DCIGQHVNPTSLRSSLTQQQCSPRGGIDLVLVMHLENFDVPLGGIERARSLLHEYTEQVHAKAHIAGLDDARMAGRSPDLLLVARRTPGCTYDVDDPRLCREPSERHRCGRAGEI